MSLLSSLQLPPPVSSSWILVVDDERPIRVLFADLLEGSELGVEGAAGADEALALLDQRATEPLVAFIDVLMPGTDGLTLTRKLRARFKQSRIVVMSGHLSDVSWWPDDLRDVDFLPKPFRRDDVLEKVADARRAKAN